MFRVRATKKLRDRARQPVAPAGDEPTTWLGDWYGTVLFLRPQLALLVDEQTLFPVLLPLAPAASLLERVPAALGDALLMLGVEGRFIEAELAEMGEGQWAKTASRSVLGVMNSFGVLSKDLRRRHGTIDPVKATLWLAQTPCGPLYQRHVCPDLELTAAVASWAAEHGN